jgi:hypothetical protein
MAKQTINVGTSANDGTGDTLRAAAQKVNSNFTEVYNTSQASFNKANTVSDSVNNVIPQVELAWNTANAAYDVANTAVSTNIDDWARGQANAAFNKANTSIYKNIVLVAEPGPITLTDTTEVVLCDPNAAGDNVIVVMPTEPVFGQTITVKNINTDGNAVYVQTTSGQYMELLNHAIEQNTYETLPLTAHAATWIWDNSAWRIINYYTGA